jgi:hypothetical protein
MRGLWVLGKPEGVASLPRPYIHGKRKKQEKRENGKTGKTGKSQSLSCVW